MIPFKIIGDFQTRKGRVLMFDKADQRVETLKVRDVVTTENGCWKLIENFDYFVEGNDKFRKLIQFKSKAKNNNGKKFKAFLVKKI